ncbi:MAG: excinuclease ABC subunit B [Candidatus Colwellbacteria bacterium CG10_big_fil_rev_8_21_14_0_10_42_22]|uniref:UvrABC system protein B n=1 Tax=Candidatus Colwellbacteria bacterium CG10_big_fil_rev_8_21_14_0_10_42_22 TaxID=1974540 RepID=A0A2H0VFH2_9BACT|nr:MAG: excinuclease ABC subunit B [Candidatus Colwellbacteria bacterium CG10_big_fil_rev_8_21_14_0_10_42_22]
MLKLISEKKPAGDQPKAIDALVKGLKKGLKHQTLLGVTGSGKTFTIANVINEVKRPTLVIAHNKTLAAQLCNEFRELFPENQVHYFVSYYDYYQPEAYLPNTNTYIAKEAHTNDEIDRLRHAATTALLTQKDVIIVASVSAIYGLGTPELYRENILHFKIGDQISREELARRLIRVQFTRTNANLNRGSFRLRGDNWEIMSPHDDVVYNFVMDKGKISKIYIVDPTIGFSYEKTPSTDEVYISPVKHYITLDSQIEVALKNIEQEMKERIKYFEKEGKLLEAEIIERRTKGDMAMIREVGYCNGIENYSRHLDGRAPGEPPATLLDYFPEDFLLVIDESHVTVPQIRGMFEGDASRKRTLIEHGFRLPSASDNRPLKFGEFEKRVGQTIYTSATPSVYEAEHSQKTVEQVIRPTGLVDPIITIRPAKGQIDDLIPRIKERIEKSERVLVTTLTKKMAEDLNDYLHDLGLKVNYLHSDVETLDRIRILTGLRRGDFDVLVGVNLLREGLDLPEVSLVAILDADKEGFLRSETALIQTIGRAARNVNGEVLIYADQITGSVKRAVSETERRRKIQIAYNKKHGITPQTIVRNIQDILPIENREREAKIGEILELEVGALPKTTKRIEEMIRDKEREMKEVAKKLDFELAAILRDELVILKEKMSHKNKKKHGSA